MHGYKQAQRLENVPLSGDVEMPTTHNVNVLAIKPMLGLNA